MLLCPLVQFRLMLHMLSCEVIVNFEQRGRSASFIMGGARLPPRFCCLIVNQSRVHYHTRTRAVNHQLDFAKYHSTLVESAYEHF